jgi:hypothetical protein
MQRVAAAVSMCRAWSIMCIITIIVQLRRLQRLAGVTWQIGEGR